MTKTVYSERVVQSGQPMCVGPALVDIEGDLIVGVRPMSRPDFDASKYQYPALDLGNRLVAPGLTNSHTHLSMSAFRGLGLAAMQGNVVEDLYFKLEAHLQPGDVRSFARMGAYDCLLSGTTAVWDHYYFADEVAASLGDVGLCGVVAPTLQDLGGPGVARLESQWKTTLSLNENAALAKRGIFAAVGPHATDTVSDNLFARIAKLAEEADLAVHLHVAQSIEEFQRSQDEHGCTPIERLHRCRILDAAPKVLLVHGLYVTESDLRRLDPIKHCLGYCPSSQIQFGFPAAVHHWQRSGIPVALGTDCGASNDSMNVQQELRLLANGSQFAVSHSEAAKTFANKGSVEAAAELEAQRRFHGRSSSTPESHERLLESVWGAPGRLSRRLAVGAIAPGKRANLVVYDCNHPVLWPVQSPLRSLTMSDTAPAIWGCMINGVWRGTSGSFQQSIIDSDAFKAHLKEAEIRREALLSRVQISIAPSAPRPDP